MHEDGQRPPSAQTLSQHGYGQPLRHSQTYMHTHRLNMSGKWAHVSTCQDIIRMCQNVIRTCQDMLGHVGVYLNSLPVNLLLGKFATVYMLLVNMLLAKTLL